MRRLALLVALFPVIVVGGLVSQGCATMGGQPLHVACLACSTLAASGACASRAPLTTTCPAGEELWIVNFDDFVSKGQTPRIECKPRRFGGELP
jgi:hypothetical protein